MKSLTAASVVILTFIVLTFQNCGSKSDGSAQLKVVFPKTSANNKLTIHRADASRSSKAPDPALNIWRGDFEILSEGDLNCFGIAVGGPDSKLQGQLCEDSSGTPFRFGVHKMGVLPGEAVSLEVSAGSAREFRILAWSAENDAACRSLLEGKKVKGNALSKPILIATQTVDLQPGDQTLNINASFANSSELNGCDIFTADTSESGQGGVQPPPVVVPPPSGHLIAGQVSGLDAGQTVVLELRKFSSESSQELSITIGGPLESLETGNGNFQFNNRLESGVSYSVNVGIHPSSKVCSVDNNFGSVGSEDINNIQVVCINNSFSIGGTVSGLSDYLGAQVELLLEVDGGSGETHSLMVSEDGTFSFAEVSLQSGQSYQIFFGEQSSPGEFGFAECELINPSGQVGQQNVSNIGLECFPPFMGE